MAGRTGLRHRTDQRPDPRARTEPKILIADDSRTQQEIVAYALRNERCRLVFASDGIEAINLVYTEWPDIILLDIEMPKMNGYHVCRLLRDDPNTTGIPVIMITSRDEQSDRFWGLQTGANHYMNKNFQPDELVSLIRKLLAAAPARLRTATGSPGRKEVDVLARLNNLLDRRLYEATLINEISQLSVSSQDFLAATQAIMGILAKVADFAVGATLLLEEKDLTLTVNHPCSPAYLELVKARVLAAASVTATEVLDLSGLKVRALDAGGSAPHDLPGQTEVVSFHALPLLAKRGVMGLLALASPKPGVFSEQAVETLRIAQSPISMVLDNARLYEETKRLAITDGLTNVFNRRHFRDVLDHEFRRARRYNKDLSVIMLDIDFFKSVNDLHGHQVGDEVLKELAARIRGDLRETDVVARYGGEEFAVILPETSVTTATQIAERLRSRMEKEKFVTGGKSLSITVSFGVSTYPIHMVSDQYELIWEADQALYRAKQEGRNRVCVSEGAKRG